MADDIERLERLQFMLSQRELATVEHWRFAHNLPNLGSAVRELMRIGLARQGIHGAATGLADPAR